jgi:hypothetical protein
MLRRPSIVFCAALCGALWLATACFGQDPAAGDVVVASAEVKLKVQDEVVATAAAGDELSVRKVQDSWLWVENAKGERGWVDRQAVKLKAGATPTPEPPPATAEPAKPADDPWLLAIGVLSGQNIYVTYAYIGSVADGYYHKVYSADQVQSLMKETVSLTDVAIEHLRKVESTKIVDSDRKAIARVVEIMGLLKQEAEALSDYTKTQSDADLQAYETARTSAWPKIKESLQME